ARLVGRFAALFTTQITATVSYGCIGYYSNSGVEGVIMSTSQIGFSSAVILLIIASVIYFYLIHRKPEVYTRDRFAFAGLTVLASLVLALINTFAGTTPWDILYAALNWTATGQFAPAPATGEGRLIIVLCMLIVAYTIIQLHRSWTGGLTEDQWKASQLHERSSLLLEGMTELKRLLTKSPAPQIHDPSKKREFAKIEPSAASAQFNIVARDLFCELHRDAVFAKDDDASWHTRGPFWLGRDRQTENYILLFCTGSVFYDADLQRALHYSLIQ